MVSGENLSGRVAFVTGGARGIGREIALRLAREGAAVAIGCHTRTEEAQKVVAQIREEGGRACVASGDLGSEMSAGELARSITEELGAPTVLIHNAAPPRISVPLLETPWVEFDRQYRIGVQAAWALAGAFAPGMRDAGFGRIILVTTTSVRLYVKGFGAYCAAKAAMETFAHYLAVELGGTGITVNVVAPGATRKSDAPHPEAGLFPLGDAAHARDVAEAVAMLASPSASALTGLVVPVDGGHRLLEPMRGRRPQ